jgi:hypothetical protein
MFIQKTRARVLMRSCYPRNAMTGACSGSRIHRRGCILVGEYMFVYEFCDFCSFQQNIKHFLFAKVFYEMNEYSPTFRGLRKNRGMRHQEHVVD